MNCPFCKAEMQEEAIFCPKCGQIQKASAATESPDKKSAYWGSIGELSVRDAKQDDELKKSIKQKLKKSRRIFIILLVAVNFGFFGYEYATKLRLMRQYNQAEMYLEEGKYTEAEDAFLALDDYNDAKQKADESRNKRFEADYQNAISSYENQEYRTAYEQFQALGDYQDSRQYAVKSRDEVVKTWNAFASWDFSRSLDECSGAEATVNSLTQIDVQNIYVDKAAAFNGKDTWIQCEKHMDCESGWTATVLFRCQDVNRSNESVISLGSGEDVHMALSVSSGHLCLTHYFEGGETIFLSNPLELENNKWYQAVLSGDDVLKLTVNGQTESSEPIPIEYWPCDIISIGRDAQYADDNVFYGEIANVAFYDYNVPEENLSLLTDSIMNLDDAQTDKTYIPSDAYFWNGHHYALFRNCTTMEEAEQYCNSRGGYLAVISTAEENEILNSISESDAVFGYRTKDSGASWSWVDGEASDFTKWMNDPPQLDSDVNYAGFAKYVGSDAWVAYGIDANNPKKLIYICEWDS